MWNYKLLTTWCRMLYTLPRDPEVHSSQNLGVFSLELIGLHVFGVCKERTPCRLTNREIIFEVRVYTIFQPVWPRYISVTDRETDGQIDDLLEQYTALCVASSGKNLKLMNTVTSHPSHQTNDTFHSFTHSFIHSLLITNTLALNSKLFVNRTCINDRLGSPL